MGEGPENRSLADEVLDELYRRDLLSATQRDYFAGSCTRSEAMAAHLSVDPVVRAAQIVRLFTSKDERVDEAIRMAVTSQSTRKRITPKLLNELATALILRAVAEDPGKVDQIRRICAVQHVHVGEGGQAIVGNVNSPAEGVGAPKKTEIQPHALAYAPGVAMSCDIEAEREAVPIASLEGT